MKIQKSPFVLPLADSFVIEDGCNGGVYEISVALPFSYQNSHKTYPVLVVLNADLAFLTTVETTRTQSSANEISEILVVGISYPDKESSQVSQQQRIHDFTPVSFQNLKKSNNIFLKQLLDEFAKKGFVLETAFGGASNFLNFLTSDLIPFFKYTLSY